MNAVQNVYGILLSILMKRISKIFDSFLPIIPYLIVCIYSMYQPSDPDLGWHLKYGEYFWQHGTVLRDNTFSTMMPDFHWANTSFLTDIIGYAIFHLGGFFGLSLAGALVVTLTFYAFAKAFRLSLWQETLVFPFVLYLENPVNAISFRGQQIALICAGVLFYLLSRYEEKPKLLWFAIPLFSLWAAIDGEFILGLALFGLWIVLFVSRNLCVSISLSKKNVRDSSLSLAARLTQALNHDKLQILTFGGIFVCSLLATFVNPFGYGIHLDALSHIGSPLLKDIAEYLPFNYLSQTWWNEVIVGIILVFGLFVLAFQGTFWEYLPILAGGLVLFILSLQIRRYAWPAYYLVFPLLAMTATFLKPDGKKATKIATAVLLGVFLIGVLWLRYPFTKYTNNNWDQYCKLQTDPCTKRSAEFLINHNLNHNLFSLYGWGGWLIWNYPQIKPSIDGRMHLWVQNGYSAFSDYYTVEQNNRDIDKTSYTVVYMSPDKPVYYRLVYLSKIGKWKQVYKDKFAGIFVRIDR
jgi:hypothetical protein